ncbi:MAG: hypothetical protein K0V04_46705 [Deltaproteobacteria bacterium]|nr:hypothetical protein [Deltaproteobacteria bacterium]
MPIKLLDHTWPLVKIYVNGEVDGHDLDEHHSRYGAMLRRGKHAIMEITQLDAPMMTSQVVRLRARFIAEHRQMLADNCMAGAYVLPSAVARGALKAVSWLQPLPFPHSVFDTEQDAEPWARKRLAIHL